MASVCPRDGTQLVEVERSGVRVDACRTCRGVWLDRGELDKILEREAQAFDRRDEEDEAFLREVTGGGRSSPRYLPNSCQTAVEGLGLALEDLVELTAIQPDAAARAARVHAHARALHLDQLRPVARAHRSHASSVTDGAWGHRGPVHARPAHFRRVCKESQVLSRVNSAAPEQVP